MKVFFASSPRGAKEYKQQFKKVYSILGELGYQHVDDDVMKASYDEFKLQMHPGRDAYVKWYKKKIDSINRADICVFEISMHSLGIGFLIQRALDYSKPVIALYYADNIPYFLSGVEDDKLMVISYKTSKLRKILKRALDKAREKRDKRFNFFLSPRLLQYIDDASTKRGITKSKLLRDMIVHHMRESAS